MFTATRGLTTVSPSSDLSLSWHLVTDARGRMRPQMLWSTPTLLPPGMPAQAVPTWERERALA